MNSNVQNKIKAIALRMQGFSYADIMKEIPVPKGTLSGWLKHITLTNDQQEKLYSNIQAKQGLARARAAASNTKRREIRESAIREKAVGKFQEYSTNRDFLIGLTLYWAEGTKKDVTWSFINSDPKMVRFMHIWMRKYLGVSKEQIRVRLFIHEPYKEEKLELFWADLLEIPVETMQKTIYKPTSHTVKKNPEYKGCVRMYVTGIEHLKTTVYWKDALVNSINM